MAIDCSSFQSFLVAIFHVCFAVLEVPTPPVGDSRLPSAVTDSTVLKQKV